MPYVSFNDLVNENGSDTMISFVRSFVSKENTIQAVERHLSNEFNVDNISECQAFWLEDDSGMNYYYSTEGLLSAYDTMLNQWGDNYDYETLQYLDACTVEIVTRDNDLRFVGFL